MKKFSRFLACFIAVMMLVTVAATLVACQKTPVSNDSTRLVLASQELDGVFNPFFSSSAPDGNIVGMTQLGMLTTDKNGNVAYGETEACAVLDYSEETFGSGEEQTTTYKFVIKNNLKFSNGSALTMKDILFNLYVYLDPAYSGSATMYSTEIVGLAEYRTQTQNPNEQESFDETYREYAYNRLKQLADVLADYYEECGGKVVPTEEGVLAALKANDEMFTALAESVAANYPVMARDYKRLAHTEEDYKRAKTLFQEELETDYRNSKDTAEDISYLDGQAKLSTDTEAFLFNEGFIHWDDEENEFVYSFGKDSANWTQEFAIQSVYGSYFPAAADAVVLGSASADKMLTSFIAIEKKAYFDTLTAEDTIKDISGITFANRNQSVTVNGTTYQVPQYNSDGSVRTGNEVLQIVIKKVDPKAIWNFAFAIAPMYYYSSAEEIAKFDIDKGHFGVAFSDNDFMNDVVNSPDKNGLPVGAGPYKVSTRSGSGEATAGTFWENNVVYFERNDNFLFPAKIKYVNYQVVGSKLMLDSLFNGDIHYVEPACKQENIDKINAKKKDGFESVDVMTNGYGYIGINAKEVPCLAVRQAIMHAINTELCLQYYAGYSNKIYRPMTRASWAYPTETDELGQYYAYDGTGATSEALVKAAGYTKNAKGILANSETGDVLEYTFTIAGDDIDHPAYNAMNNAATILNSIGFKITVKKDIHALKKLNTGDLAVWAAAWGSGVDPDMYQVYHKDSTAGSTANWGYNVILSPSNKTKYAAELAIIEELSDLIDEARETTNQTVRKQKYALALDKVMELAVELPTYQRCDLFAYNTNIIDETSLPAKEDLTPFNGPLAKLWEISLKES